MAGRKSKQPSKEGAQDHPVENEPSPEAGGRYPFELSADEIHEWQRGMQKRFLRMQGHWEPCEIGALMAYPEKVFDPEYIDERALTYEVLVSNEGQLGGKWERKRFRTLGDAWKAHFEDPQDDYDDWRRQWSECTTRVQRAIQREDLPSDKGLVLIFHAILWMSGDGFQVPPEWLEQAQADVTENPDRYIRSTQPAHEADIDLRQPPPDSLSEQAIAILLIHYHEKTNVANLLAVKTGHGRIGLLDKLTKGASPDATESSVRPAITALQKRGLLTKGKRGPGGGSHITDSGIKAAEEIRESR